MTKKSNIDKVTKEIFQNSLLELTDPRFDETTMEKIIQASRRRRLLDNLFLGFLIFTAVDTLIILALWMTHLNVVDVALRLFNMPEKLFLQAAQLKNVILGNGFIHTACWCLPY